MRTLDLFDKSDRRYDPVVALERRLLDPTVLPNTTQYILLPPSHSLIHECRRSGSLH